MSLIFRCIVTLGLLTMGCDGASNEDEAAPPPDFQDLQPPLGAATLSSDEGDSWSGTSSYLLYEKPQEAPLAHLFMNLRADSQPGEVLVVKLRPKDPFHPFDGSFTYEFPIVPRDQYTTVTIVTETGQTETARSGTLRGSGRPDQLVELQLDLELQDPAGSRVRTLSGELRARFLVDCGYAESDSKVVVLDPHRSSEFCSRLVVE